jgi:hypothetical protein
MGWMPWQGSAVRPYGYPVGDSKPLSSVTTGDDSEQVLLRRSRKQLL